MHPVDPGDDGVPRIHPEDAAEWRAWLAEHHASAGGVWAVRWRAGHGDVPLDYEGLVREALCFGWIDSRPRKLDAERTMLYFAPRRPGSGWARPNKQRIAELEAVSDQLAELKERYSEAVNSGARGTESARELEEIIEAYQRCVAAQTEHFAVLRNIELYVLSSVDESEASIVDFCNEVAAAYAEIKTRG